MNFEKEKQRIAEINQKYVTVYKECFDAADAEIREGLRTGHVMPRINGIATQAQRDKLRERAAELRAEAMESVNRIRDNINATRTEAPSPEAVNYIQLMNMRDYVSQEDLDEAVAAYGGNYSALRAINHIARQHDKMPYDHPVERQAEALESLTKSVSRMGADVQSDPDHIANRADFVNMALENL